MNADADVADTSGSTGRLLLAQAPAGLSLVQDLLNTASMPVFSIPDLLEDATTAQNWLEVSLGTWSRQTGRPPLRITIHPADLAPLRDLRRQVRSWVSDEGEDRAPHPLAASVSFGNGHLTYGPSGDGAPAVTSLVLIEALLASHTGALSRLKTCLNPACGAAFYDLSRNSTRIWHDVKTCKNVMNLRASRARRRESTTG